MIYDLTPTKRSSKKWDSNMKTPDAKKDSLKVTQTTDVAKVDLGDGAPAPKQSKPAKGQTIESRLVGPAAQHKDRS